MGETRAIRVRVLFFAGLRDVFGQEEMEWPLEAGATLDDLVEEMFRGRDHKDRELKSIRIGVNQDFASLETLLQDGDEVALLPPSAGG